MCQLSGERKKEDSQKLYTSLISLTPREDSYLSSSNWMIQFSAEKFTHTNFFQNSLYQFFIFGNQDEVSS
jgi:hypothetical protein